MDRNTVEKTSMDLPLKTIERIDFLKRILGASSRSVIVARAVELLDRVAYPVLFEGSKAVLQHKNDTWEHIEP